MAKTLLKSVVAILLVVMFVMPGANVKAEDLLFYYQTSPFIRT